MANTIQRQAPRTTTQNQGGGFFRSIQRAVKSAVRDVMGSPQAPVQKSKRLDHYAAGTSYTEAAAKNLNQIANRGTNPQQVRNSLDPQILSFLNDISKNGVRG